MKLVQRHIGKIFLIINTLALMYHRQLTWGVSKLKNIEFDEFADWEVAYLFLILLCVLIALLRLICCKMN